MSQQQLRRHCDLPVQGQRLLADAIDKLGLSARAFHRILRVARTVADLEASGRIEARHLTEAIGYRRLDRAEI
jgi:magnesium chelatase family protein